MPRPPIRVLADSTRGRQYSTNGSDHDGQHHPPLCPEVPSRDRNPHDLVASSKTARTHPVEHNPYRKTRWSQPQRQQPSLDANVFHQGPVPATRGQLQSQLQPHPQPGIGQVALERSAAPLSASNFASPFIHEEDVPTIFPVSANNMEQHASLLSTSTAAVGALQPSYHVPQPTDPWDAQSVNSMPPRSAHFDGLSTGIGETSLIPNEVLSLPQEFDFLDPSWIGDFDFSATDLSGEFLDLLGLPSDPSPPLSFPQPPDSTTVGPIEPENANKGLSNGTVSTFPAIEALTTMFVPPDLETKTLVSRNRMASPEEPDVRKEYLGFDGQVQGVELKFQGTDRKTVKRVKAKKICERCKIQRTKCEDFQTTPYLPCVGCRKMTTTKFLIHPCVIDAYLLDIRLFRLGPPEDNPAHPLNFQKARQDVLDLADSSYTGLPSELILELTQHEVGEVLYLSVSKYKPLPGDRTAYEGYGNSGPYRLEMPPYSISDLLKAKRSIMEYVERTKTIHVDKLVDREDAALRMGFEHAMKCPKPLVQKALSIWAATRLIEHTWYLCGKETLGINRSVPRDDPWNGSVPVTPIMDQQLDQIVIREFLVPQRDGFLNALAKKMRDEKDRRESWLEIALAIMVMLHNAEMQIAAERDFARCYGLSGRYGPKGKYQDAEAQIHAARAMLGHFHHSFRGGAILSDPSKKALGGLPLDDGDAKLLRKLNRSVASRKSHFEKLRSEARYEANGFFVSQMFDRTWDGGTGYIVEEEQGEEEQPGKEDGGILE